MARIVNKNEVVIDEFSSFAPDNVTKISGLSLGAGDFTPQVFFNKTLVPYSSVGLSIGEYGTSGSYWVEWTPNQLGFWEVEVKVNQTGQYWFETFDVFNARDPGSESNIRFEVRGTVVWNVARDEMVAMAWLDKNGQTVSDPGNCKWDFYDSENTLLFSLTQNTPFPPGIYRAKKAGPPLLDEENYYYIAQIHDGNNWRKSALSFITLL